MKLEKTDMEILACMVRNIEEKYSIKQLADQLKRPYVKVHSSIQRLIKKNIVRKKITGKSHYCWLDYQNNLDIASFVEAQRTRKFLKNRKDIKILVENIKEKIGFPDYLIVIFGSVAKKTNTRNSDIDLAIICSKESLKQTERTINTLGRISSINIHLIGFTYFDFIEMLKAKELTVGKEIAKNHIIVHGHEQFYECLRLAA